MAKGDQGGRKWILPHITDRLALAEGAKQSCHPPLGQEVIRASARKAINPQCEEWPETRDPDRETSPLGI